MKATIRVDLPGCSAGDAQRALREACGALLREGVISAYEFEIESAHGTVGDKCILSGDTVVA